MRYRHLSPLLPLFLGLSLGQAQGAPPVPAAGAGYEYVTARIPDAQQRIAPAALAQLNILLYRAKRSAAKTLCDGNWLAEGRLVQQSGPLPVTTADGALVWLYSAAREAAPLPCGRVSRQRFSQEMLRHLPHWVSLGASADATAVAAATYSAPESPR